MSPAAEGSRREVLQLLGVALRAGRLVVGTEAVKDRAEAGELAAAVVAEDAGENARDRVCPLLERAGVTVWEVGSRSELGAALGRGPVVVAGLTDRGFADAVAKKAAAAPTSGGRT